MKTAQFDQLRDRLLAMQARLEIEIERNEEATAQQVNIPGELSNVPNHTGDHASEGFDASVAVSQTLRQELDEVNGALERIRTGSYGICVRCEKEIGEARLDALPQTPVCIQCARETEAQGGEG